MTAANTEPFVHPSSLSTLAFVGVIAIVFGAYSWMFYRVSTVTKNRKWLLGPLAMVFWLFVTAMISASGVLQKESMPPPVLLFFLGSNALAIGLAMSKVGDAFSKYIPVALLVGIHGFRLPLELVLFQWWAEGVIPVQMTFHGYNFDIVTGIVSLLGGLYLLARRNSPVVVLVINILGTFFLAAVATIAVLCSPVPMRVFFDGPALLLAFYAPYSWIVTMCVSGALFGHIVTYRWCLRQMRGHSLNMEQQSVV